MLSLESRPTSTGAARARRKFLKLFPGGFGDETYVAWERDYKIQAHEHWNDSLNQYEYRSLLRRHRYSEIAAQAVRIESRTNLLFSFEKMAIRDAIATSRGARLFAEGLYEFVYRAGDAEKKFDQWCETVASLPRKQTRVLTWPVVTVFAFIACPHSHIFFKPKATRAAALKYGYDFPYSSRPSWAGYAPLLNFAKHVRRDLADLRPRDLIDIQSFIWVVGSDEYAA